MILKTSKLWFVFLFCTVSLYAINTETLTPNDTFISKSTLRIPLYEQYPLINNAIANQTILYSIRGMSIGATIGAIAGIFADIQSGDVFIPASIIYGTLGAGAGFIVGIPIGTFRGFQIEKYKKVAPSYHTRRCQFGYEILAFDFATIINNRNMYRLNAKPGISLLYRPLAESPFVPGKIGVGFYQEEWGPNNGMGSSVTITTVDGAAQFDFFKTPFSRSYGSCNIGYSWIQERHNGDSYFQSETPILRISVGTEISVFDFFFADAKIGYEAIGAYLAIQDKELFTSTENLLFSCSFGTYIF